MKKIDVQFFLWGIFVPMLFMATGCCVNHHDVEVEKNFEYRRVGGVPGESRIDNVLTINNKGECEYRTLKIECSFILTQREVQHIFKETENIAQNSQERKGEFLPDSHIAGMRIYENKLIHEMIFYADASLEREFPELRRPEQFKRLEERLKDLIDNHCDLPDDDPYFLY